MGEKKRQKYEKSKKIISPYDQWMCKCASRLTKNFFPLTFHVAFFNNLSVYF